MLMKNLTFTLIMLCIVSCATEVSKIPGSTLNGDATQSSVAGSIHIRDDVWQVVDAIAMREERNVKITFTDHPFDRNDFAVDGKLDGFDILRHKGHTLTLNFDADGPTMCLDFTNDQGGGSKCNSDYQSALVLSARTNDRITGKMHWGEKNAEHVHVSFDLPLESKVVRAGEPLPADGGAPGLAVLAHFSAIAGGDFETIKAQAHPQRVAQMKATNQLEAKAMIKMLQEITANNIKILGGVINGENAIVDYAGENHSQKISGVAELSRYQGRWYVNSTNESADTSK